MEGTMEEDDEENREGVDEQTSGRLYASPDEDYVNSRSNR